MHVGYLRRALLISCIAAVHACAFEATALLQNNPEKPTEKSSTIGVFISHCPSNDITRLWDKPVRWTDFSPDGKKLLIVTTSDTLYTMDNDGSALKKVCHAEDIIQPLWTEKGIYHLYDGVLNIIDPENGTKTKIYDLADYATFCVNKLEYRFHGSRDGLRLWFREKMNPKEIPEWNCETTGYGRGIKLYVHFSSDLSTHWRFWQKYWGHGDGMTMSGYLMLVHMGEHHELGISKQYQDSLYYYTLYSNMDGVVEKGKEVWFDPAYPGTLGSPKASVNNDSIIGAITSGTYHILNWRTNKLIGKFKLVSGMDYDGCSRNFWCGPLPNPRDNSPYLSIDKQSLSFSIAGATNPAKQIVTITNKGTETLGKVTASVSPSSDWLSVTVEGSGGNTQTISCEVIAGKLTSDKSEATVAVSGGGASNAVSFTVQAFKGSALAAPTKLAAVASGDSLLDATLTWEDNAEGETGYVIERRKSGGSWETAGDAGADASSYTDKRLAYGAQYEYRLYAVKDGGSNSDYSNVANVLITGIEWIRVTNPKQGDKLKSNAVCEITWTCNLVDQVYIECSKDGGLTWEVITPEGGILEGSKYWPAYPWTTPNEELNDVLIRVAQYADPTINGVSSAFSISPNASVQNIAAGSDRKPAFALISNSRLQISIPSHQRYALSVWSVSGKLMNTHEGVGPDIISIACARIPKGMYILRCRIGIDEIVKPVAITR